MNTDPDWGNRALRGVSLGVVLGSLAWGLLAFALLVVARAL